MQITNEELAAARQLGEAIVRLLVAVEEGSRTRNRQASRQLDTRIATQSSGPRRKAEPDRDEKLLISQREAAEMLSISGKTLWNLTAPRGPIPAIRIGVRAVRYRMADVLEALSRYSQLSSGDSP